MKKSIVLKKILSSQTKENKTIFFFIMPLFFLLLVNFCGCKSGANPEPTSRENASSPLKTQVPATAENDKAHKLWDSYCSGCHSRKELSDIKAGDIQRALKDIDSMTDLGEDLSEEDIRSLEEFLTTNQQTSKYEYLGSKRCRACHPGQFAQWQPSLHALAHFEPVYDHYFIKASIESNQGLETFCARCHTPIAVFNGNIPFPKTINDPGDTHVSPAENDGVQCDFCHLISGVKELNNSGYIMTPSKTKFGPYKDSNPKGHSSTYSALHKSADLCGTCHNVNHPVNGIVLEATYTEWKESPYAKEGIICQDCHMTEGLIEKQAHPGKAARQGPERKHVSRHYFVGPNLLYSDSPEAEKLKHLSQALLKKSGKITIGIPTVKNKELNIPVTVTNTGAGHYLPTGITELRQLWLEIKITDKKGTTLLHSGGLDKNHNIKKGAFIYFTDVIDKTGQSTTKFWNTVKKVSDRRIPPKGKITEIVRLPQLNGDTPLTIEAALKYRSISPKGLKEVDFPLSTLNIPVFTIDQVKLSWKGP